VKLPPVFLLLKALPSNPASAILEIVRTDKSFAHNPHIVFWFKISLTFWLSLFIIIACCGCSSFNRYWRRASANTSVNNSFTGRWEGQWISDAHGHHGHLRCLMTQSTNSLCLAQFRASYGGIFHFTYTVPLEMQSHDIGWEFDGEANLGKLSGGVYYYEGRATSTNLISTYRSKHDHGRFELGRPK
jgi:hypothetical protein